MKFIKLYRPKSQSNIYLNVENVVYMKDAGAGFGSTLTMIYTTDKDVIGVSESIDEIMNKINNQ